MIRIPLRSTSARVIAALIALALFAGIVWWGAINHRLVSTLVSLAVVGVIVVGSRLLRRSS